MNYQERVQRALDSVEEHPLSPLRGFSYRLDGFNIECIHLAGDRSSSETYWACVEVETNYLSFHYTGESFDIDRYGEKNFRDDWGFTLSTFGEVGQLIQPIYQSWLDENNYELETKTLDDAPWVISVIKKKEDR